MTTEKRNRQTRAVRRSRLQIVRLVESGGALAEALLLTLRTHQIDDETTDVLKSCLSSWDEAVLEVPEEWL